jgi:hypothetical protein
MGRQNQSQRDHSSSLSGTDLFNFHFTAGPPPQQQQNNNNARRRSHNDNQNHQNYSNNNQFSRRKKQENRTAVRRKPNSHMFHLHSSADHAFVINRHGLKQQQHSFSGSDEAVSWEAVRMVKVLVPTEHPEAACCPICLDSLVCARITKCGHFYCLACLLRHVQMHAQTNPYTHVKCPCCAVPLHVTELRAVLLTSSIPPKLHQRMKLVKLHRTKDCPSPYLPLPIQPKRSTTHAAPCMTDPDAPFCRWNYIHPQSYQRHLADNKVELEKELAKLTGATTHPKVRYQNEVEAIFVTSALDFVCREVQRAIEEADQEEQLAEAYSSTGSGVYQMQPPHLVASHYEYVSLPHPQQQEQQRDSFGEADTGHGSFGERQRTESEGSEAESFARRYRGDSIGSYASMDTSQSQMTAPKSDNAGESELPASPSSQQKASRNNKRSSKPLQFPKASMFLDDDGSTHFYQCEDGQLCFLSRFNMSCLVSDFSPKVPDFEAVSDIQNLAEMSFWQRRSLLPLPDTVEGEILEIESVHLTPDMRKRWPFLAHLPLFCDIHFVELDLNTLLSCDTKRKFKVDLEKRRKRRQSKVKAEKREDKIARQKEDERINELKARMQQIDPNDEFFQISLPEDPPELTGEAFGPAMSSGNATRSLLVAAAANVNPAFSFSNVCQSGGVFPTLAVNAESNFPALGSSPPCKKSHPQAVSSWGSPSRANIPQQSSPNWGPGATKVNSAPQAKPTNNNAALPVSKQPPVPGGKKKTKGKKIVLFSTGGQRGTSY